MSTYRNVESKSNHEYYFACSIGQFLMKTLLYVYILAKVFGPKKTFETCTSALSKIYKQKEKKNN